MTLQFGTITFSDPVKLAQWRPESGPGLYCVCMVDRNWHPVPYQPIFFSLAHNLAVEDLLGEQVALESWAAYAGESSKLFVAHAGLPYFSAGELLLFERQLVAQYQPACNHWEALTQLAFPMQRRTNVLVERDRASLALQPDPTEKKYVEI